MALTIYMDLDINLEGASQHSLVIHPLIASSACPSAHLSLYDVLPSFFGALSQDPNSKKSS